MYLETKSTVLKKQLDCLFRPKTIAVIGATNTEGKAGYVVFKNILDSAWKGNVYPVNLKYKKVQGRQCYRYLQNVPQEVDLVIITTPARTVVGLIKECGRAKVGGVVILSSDFKTYGDRRYTMYHNIAQATRQFDLRVIGPNSLGFIHPHFQLNASAAKKTALPGKIAFISQSATLANSILDWSLEQNVGFSHFISVGSMADVGFGDLIDYFGTDSNTSCILLYMQNLTKVRQFMSAARAFSRSKPIIVLKAGDSTKTKPAYSHSGTLLNSDSVYEAAFRRAGIIQVSTIAQLFNCAQALAMQRLPSGNQLAIITNAGGPGALATNHLRKQNGQLATFSEKTVRKLKEKATDLWSIGNPLDLEIEATPDDFAEAVQICARDAQVDGLLVILTPQNIAHPTAVAKKIEAAAEKINKTILAAWMGEQDVAEGRMILEQGKVPVYRYPESAVDVFLKMHAYAENLQLLQETPPNTPAAFQPQTKDARQLIEQAFRKRRLKLNESEAKQLLTFYNIPTAPHQVVQTETAAVQAAKEIGLPVVLKILSPELPKKTILGGVCLDLRTITEVRKAYKELQSVIEQRELTKLADGILVEKMIEKPHELLIGAKKDPTFGPAILFGKGGIAVEVFQDINLGLPPLNMILARHILEQTKTFQLLEGYRGLPPVDVEQLQFLLCKFAYLVMDFPEIQEIDINPFAVDENGGVVLDAHILLDQHAARSPRQRYSHLVISPYPSEYVKPVKLKDGTPAILRPIRPEDEPLEKELFHYLSEKTIYFRFFGYLPQLTHDMLARFTQIDYDRELAIVAEIEQNGKKRLIGVVRLIADAWNEKAEYAIVVADDFQGQGIGNTLTNYIFEIAKERGIRKIYASVLTSNDRMLHMFDRRGFKKRKEDFETYYVEKEL